MRLQTRLFLSFIVAVVCGMVAATAGVSLTLHEGADRPVHVVARAVGANLASRWLDAPAIDAYVREVKAASGLEVTVLRDVSSLPEEVRRAAKHNVLVVFRPEAAFIPVVSGSTLLGAAALKIDPPPARWLRPLASVVVSLAVFAFAARRVSRQIAAPLERVAAAADRLGGGDLSARAQVGDAGAEALSVGRAFDAMATRVERLVRDQRELLGAVSHELRSPLGRARVALEIAREHEDKAAALDKLETHLEGVDRILGDLLDVTRAGLSDLQKSPIELGAWLAIQLPPDEAAIAAPVPANVLADEALLRRVVHNLASNAHRHGHPDGEPFRVSVEVVGEVARVTFADRGPGFDAAVVARAFEPFVRGDVARSPRDGGGAGLGLAIVKRVVEAHGGSVGAGNAQTGGAAVWFELPLAPPPPTL